MAGVVAVPEHVQEVGLRLPCPGLSVKVEALDVDLSAAGGLGELPGVLDEGLLQVAHDRLPDGALHGEVALQVTYVVLGQRPRVVQVGAGGALALLHLPLFLAAGGRCGVVILAARTDRDGAVGGSAAAAARLVLLEVAGQLLVEAVVGAGPLPRGAPVPPLVELLLVARAPALAGRVLRAGAGEAGQGHPATPLVQLTWVT